MSKTLLLADESMTIQRVVELTLSTQDIAVTVASDGQSAIEKVQKAPPDIVIASISLPRKDGYQLCELIKTDPRLTHIAVMLLFGAFQPFDKDRAVRVRCDATLSKPFEPQALIDNVQLLLAKPRR